MLLKITPHLTGGFASAAIEPPTTRELLDDDIPF